MITVISTIVMIAVSHAPPEPNYDSIRSLTFSTATEEDKLGTRASWSWREVAASAGVLACILASYHYFHG